MNRKSVIGVPIKHYFIYSHIYKMAALTHCNSFMYTENIKFYHFFTHRNMHYLYERISIQQRWFDLIKKKTLLYIIAVKLSMHDCDKFLETLGGVSLAAWTQPSTPLATSFDFQQAYALLHHCDTSARHHHTHIQPQPGHGPVLLHP